MKMSLLEWKAAKSLRYMPQFVSWQPRDEKGNGCEQGSSELSQLATTQKFVFVEDKMSWSYKKMKTIY